jgi:hypothetical protein
LTHLEATSIVVLSVSATTLLITAVSTTLNVPTIPTGTSIAPVLDELLENGFVVKSVVGADGQVVYTLVKY